MRASTSALRVLSTVSWKARTGAVPSLVSASARPAAIVARSFAVETPSAQAAGAGFGKASVCLLLDTAFRNLRKRQSLISLTRAGIYPGNKKIAYVTELDVHPPEYNPVMPAFRIMNEAGEIIPGAVDPEIGRDQCLQIYSSMIRQQTMDNVFYDAQRQGRISFYMTSWGEEGTHLGTALALKPDDEVFAQYREAGVLMWRGFSLQNFADQCFSNKDDLGKGRQMPVHYGSAQLHFQTISSPLTTQLPQAAGAAYACKVEGKGRVVACYFGDGAASEGDFHAGMERSTVLAT
jgi:hypothetical protein